MPNFRPVLNILPVGFNGGVLLLLLVPGEKQSKLLDLSLGLGLEFDKNQIINDEIKHAINNVLINKKFNNIFVFPNTPLQLMLDVSCLLFL